MKISGKYIRRISGKIPFGFDDLQGSEDDKMKSISSLMWIRNTDKISNSFLKSSLKAKKGIASVFYYCSP